MELADQNYGQSQRIKKVPWSQTQLRDVLPCSCGEQVWAIHCSSASPKLPDPPVQQSLMLPSIPDASSPFL